MYLPQSKFDAETSMVDYEPGIKIDPTDDISYYLEENSCYDAIVEQLKAEGKYSEIVRQISRNVDWKNLFESFCEAENTAIAEATKAILGQ